MKDHLLEAGRARAGQLQRDSRYLKWSRLFQSEQLDPLLTNPTELAEQGRVAMATAPNKQD